MEDLSWVFEKLCNERGVKVTREVQRMLRGRTAYGLRELDFSRAYLPKKVYPVLADLVSFCCNAQTLNVSHGQVDNESLGHLELALAEHPSLTSLDFSHNDELSLAAGKQLLDAARANTNLLHVDLQHTAVSEVYQNRIQLQLELNEAQLVHAKELTNETGDDMGGVGKPCAVIRTRLQLGSAEGVDDEEWDDYSNPDDESAVAARLESEQRVLEHESLVLGSPGQPDEPDEELIVCPPQTVTRAPGELVTSVEPACRQNIETITTELFDSTAPLARWTDPVFPPSPASLITQGGVLQRQRKCRKVSWVRASQAAHIDKSRPVTLFHDQSRPSPPMPGVWANTYLLHSMSVLVRHPQLLTRLFTKARPEIGVYEVQISKGGKWLKVVVDDWLPCDADGLLCMRSADGNEMWPSLLEKAFAKLHGGWDRIERGSVTAALSDLTACVTHNIVLRNHRRAKEIVADGSYWATLRAYNRDAWIVAAAAKAASAVQRAALEETGIAPNRPYEVVSFVEAGEWRLVELFSPYAESADDPVWLTSRWLSEQPQAARQYLEPKLLPAIDRGSRWITFENFATYFDKVYVNRSDTSVTASYQQRTQRLVGEWTGPSAGGKLRCQYFTENPCWCLRVSTKNTLVLIQLSQQDPRLLRKGGLPRIGLYVVKSRDPTQKKRHWSRQDVVVTPRFAAGTRDVVTEIVCQPNENYFLIPCTEAPGVTQPFQMVLMSSCIFNVKEVPSALDQELKVTGAWKGHTAGGRTAHSPTWLNNPQFLLTVHEPGNCAFILHQKTPEGEAPHYISFAIYAVPENKTRVVAHVPAQSLPTPDFAPHQTVFSEMQLSAGRYNIIPMTWAPREEALFELSVITRSKVVIEALSSLLA